MSGGALEEGAFSITPTGDLHLQKTTRSTKGLRKCSLIIIQSGYTYSLDNKDEFTIGRVSTDQLILPDIDLSDHEAYAKGVSRLHAKLRINNNQVSLMDLGSSNGTRVNGQRISPHIEYPLENNDILAFGKLQVRLILSSNEEVE